MRNNPPTCATTHRHSLARFLSLSDALWGSFRNVSSEKPLTVVVSSCLLLSHTHTHIREQHWCKQVCFFRCPLHNCAHSNLNVYKSEHATYVMCVNRRAVCVCEWVHDFFLTITGSVRIACHHKAQHLTEISTEMLQNTVSCSLDALLTVSNSSWITTYTV